MTDTDVGGVMEWVENLTVGQVVATAAAVIGLFVVLRRAWQAATKVIHLVDDLNGEEARKGVPARPGLMERMATVEDKVASISSVETDVSRIRKEVLPNDGSTLRDEVRRVEADVKLIEGQFAEHLTQAAAESELLVRLAQRMLPEGHPE